MAQVSKLVVILSLVPISFGCGKKKEAAPQGDENAAAVCESNSDCEAGWTCLDGKCANMGHGAVYADPASAVTPDKVKGELDKIQENRDKRADEILDGL